MQLNTVVLPAPLGPISAVDLAALGLEAQIADGDQPAELHRQVLELEDRACHRAVAHQACPSLVKEPDTDFLSCRNAVGSRLPTSRALPQH